MRVELFRLGDVCQTGSIELVQVASGGENEVVGGKGARKGPLAFERT